MTPSLKTTQAWLLILAAFTGALGLPSLAMAGDSAVVLMYHRFGDERYPSTNITLEQFEAHIKELKTGKYTVLPLPEIIRRQQNGEDLPDRTVGISIDDAYLTAYEEAFPRLREAGLPFTLFVSTGPVDNREDGMMSWDQVREMAEAGVTIGAHTVSHLHMPDYSVGRLKQEIEDSNRRYEEELGFVPTLFAYPYGEASQAAIDTVRDAGYVAAFGQHSGAFNSGDFIFYLPRFPLNEQFGDPGRFKTAANALALSVTDVTPSEVHVTPAGEAPAMGFTLREPLPRLDELSCFLSHAGKAEVMRLGRRFEIRTDVPFPAGRTRLNCTVPGGGEHAGRWHWFGQQYYQSEN